jgi:proteasome lid subunit RPN8/RPN11
MLTFSFGVIERISRQVELFPLVETGGLLAGGGESVTHALPATNEALRPAREFTIGVEQMYDLLRSIEDEGHRLLGSYHSHPNRNAQMSGADAAMARSTGVLLIIAPGKKWQWRLWDPVVGGEVDFAIEPPRA